MNLLPSVALLFALLQVPPSIPATFEGVFRGVENGHVVIEVANAQTMRMFVTSSTKFIREGKTVKAKEFEDGDPVTVEAERDARMNLVALRVVAAKPKAPKPGPEKLN